MFLLLVLLVSLRLMFMFATTRLALRGSEPAERSEILQALAEMFHDGGNRPR